MRWVIAYTDNSIRVTQPYSIEQRETKDKRKYIKGRKHTKRSLFAGTGAPFEEDGTSISRRSFLRGATSLRSEVELESSSSELSKAPVELT